MTKPAVALRESSLSQHLDTVQAQIRRQPADADLRAQLFQLMVVQGDWSRAAEQLKLCAQLNSQAQPMAVVYEHAIAAERQRESVLAGQGEPAYFGAPPDWFADMVQALHLDAADPAQAAELRARAYDAAQVRGGRLEADAAPAAFEWISDGDSRLGPVFEFLSGGRYGWLPFSALRAVRLLVPEGLCDVVWAQAEITLQDGATQHGLVPARYPAPVGTALADLADGAKLGRMTDWQPLHGDTYAGVGQKMWITDQGEYALLDVRTLELA
ncbi:type VI secretion system accessory protein TagJ [Bordetella sp. BOR01]|uniref:type VI secretion system accessory protein TagJ n=1 Tax=Bordetella sp. BOR01 TaxID=2854779 RepID=UPI001C4579A6|nr:type VI secretion system accessory protein TagJ [Bordetella sp. BOR01]MBV7483528.1 ImpE family protein [Bordetella sp. BOR01]